MRAIVCSKALWRLAIFLFLSSHIWIRCCCSFFFRQIYSGSQLVNLVLFCILLRRPFVCLRYSKALDTFFEQDLGFYLRYFVASGVTDYMLTKVYGEKEAKSKTDTERLASSVRERGRHRNEFGKRNWERMRERWLLNMFWLRQMSTMTEKLREIAMHNEFKVTTSNAFCPILSIVTMPKHRSLTFRTVLFAHIFGAAMQRPNDTDNWAHCIHKLQNNHLFGRAKCAPFTCTLYLHAPRFLSLLVSLRMQTLSYLHRFHGWNDWQPGSLRTRWIKSRRPTKKNRFYSNASEMSESQWLLCAIK